MIKNIKSYSKIEKTKTRYKKLTYKLQKNLLIDYKIYSYFLAFNLFKF